MSLDCYLFHCNFNFVKFFDVKTLDIINLVLKYLITLVLHCEFIYTSLFVYTDTQSRRIWLHRSMSFKLLQLPVMSL